MAKNRYVTEAQMANDITFQSILDTLCEYALSVFEWKNLPDTIDPRFLEKTLLYQGQALIFEDPIMGPMVTRVAQAGQWDIYDIPITRQAYCSNGYSNTLTKDNSVLIWNNQTHSNHMFPRLQVYATRLTDLERSIDLNVMGQKTPWILPVNDDNRLTVDNIMTQVMENVRVIRVNDKFNADAITPQSVLVPYLADKLDDHSERLWGEAMRYIGINYHVDKAERMLVNEQQSSQSSVTAQQWSRLEPRKKACEEMNKMFGWNVDVCVREAMDATDPEANTMENDIDTSDKEETNE